MSNSISYRQHLKELINRRTECCGQIQAAMRATFPVGSEVQWLLGEHLQIGTVLMHGLERLKVRHFYTKKEFWINLHRVEL